MITVIEISPKSYIDFEAFAEECGKMGIPEHLKPVLLEWIEMVIAWEEERQGGENGQSGSLSKSKHQGSKGSRV